MSHLLTTQTSVGPTHVSPTNDVAPMIWIIFRTYRKVYHSQNGYIALVPVGLRSGFCSTKCWFRSEFETTETKGQKEQKTDTGSRVCGDYILIFREWKRLIDRLTDKNTARWMDGWMDGWVGGWVNEWVGGKKNPTATRTTQVIPRI